MRIIFTFLFTLCYIFIYSQKWERTDLRIFDSFSAFESTLHIENDTTYLINFWATWCGPCVAELPYIEAMHDRFKDRKFKNILVSLDFEKQIDKKLIPFLNRHKIQSDVIVLLDGKSSHWIDKVDPQWSGAIPITIIYNREERVFLEKQFHNEEELIDLIKPFLKS